MVKLTNREAANFLSPVLTELLNAKDRRFPVADAFRLAEMIEQINSKIKVYQEQTRAVIGSHNGSIGKDGKVTYSSTEGLVAANKELDELNRIVVEVQGNKVEQKDSWPPLSLQEAFILRPIVKITHAKET